MQKIIPVIMVILLLAIVFFPSVSVVRKVYYDDSKRGYGEDTHLIINDSWGEHIFYGVDYSGNMFFMNFGPGWMYNKSLEAPMGIGDWAFSGEDYLSDSVAYIGGVSGHIYYVDPTYGSIIWTIDLSRLHIYFNGSAGNDFYGYYILWGNRSGYFYVLFNDTIYYLYRDVRIIDSYHYNFSGYLISAHRWNGGFILKFGTQPKPWLDNEYSYNVYYVKDGKILWNLTLQSAFYKYQSDAPDVYIYEDYVYHFSGSNVIVYKDGTLIRNFGVEGNVTDIKRIGNDTFVFTYSGLKNLLLLYNKDFHIVKKVELFDMKSMGVKKYYSFLDQKVSMYSNWNNTGYIVFLYTCSIDGDYVPLRIVHLSKDLNIMWKTWVTVYGASEIYPLWNKNRFILISTDFPNLYVVTSKKEIIIDPFAWASLKILIVTVSLIVVGYVLSQYLEYLQIRKKYGR